MRHARLIAESRRKDRTSVVNRLRRSHVELGAGLALMGCFLAFYLIGFLLVGLGAWVWWRMVQPMRAASDNA